MSCFSYAYDYLYSGAGYILADFVPTIDLDGIYILERLEFCNAYTHILITSYYLDPLESKTTLKKNENSKLVLLNLFMTSYDMFNTGHAP